MKKGKFFTSILWEDIGVLLFLATTFAGVLLVGTADISMTMENAVMLFFMFAGVVFAAFSRTTGAIAILCMQILCYTVYKLFRLYTYGESIAPHAYIWLVLPALSIGSMLLFDYGRSRTSQENLLLRQQVESLVMVDPLTGLYNLRSFYHDITGQIQYAKRNALPLSLLMVRLRYEPELRRLLTSTAYDRLKQRLAQIVQDNIRLEDKPYSIDQAGSLAVLLTTDREGTVLVRNRLREKISDPAAFDGIVNSSIRVEVQMAFLEYDDSLGLSPMAYKERVESELQYDV